MKNVMQKFQPILTLFLIVATYPKSILAQQNKYENVGKRVYIDSDLNVGTVTKDPGVTWQMCKVSPDLCLAWPDASSSLTLVPDSKPQMIEIEDPHTGMLKQSLFSEVYYSYTREYWASDGTIKKLEQKGRGWIDSSILRSEALPPMYRSESDQKPSEPKACNACQESATQSNQDKLSEAFKGLNQSPLQKLNSSVELLKPHIGICPLDPPNKKRKGNWKGQNIYDTEVLPLFSQKPLKALSQCIPKEVQPGQIECATRDDLIGIDTLARTIYAEMNECFKIGLEFPMAAAKVALNRAQMADQGRAPASYVGNTKQVSSKPNISKVLTAPLQFSVWNSIGAANPKDKTSLMALCPTRDSSKKNWKNSPPGPDDVYAWDKSLQIATEAVLYPNEFNKKTKHVTQVYYTSKRTSFLNQSYKRPNPPPKIERRPVDSFRCMYLWEKD